MPLGIGAGGQAGLAFELTPPPVVAGTATTGGALTAGTYKYYVTALTAVGETGLSNEVTVTTSAGNLTSTLTWGAVTGATGYKVYRTAAAGLSGSELLLATLGVVLTYADAAVGAPSGALPTTSTAYAPGVYVPPTKFFPFNNESLKFVQATKWRRPIRKSADVIGASPGNANVEGDMEVEVLEDVLPYFLMCARTSWTRTGSAPNYVYAFTPTSAAVPTRTFSLTLERTGGVVFGYVGCIVSAIKFSVSDGEFISTISIIALDEASQTTPTPTWPSTTPYGAGQYSIEIPTGTPVLDTDMFEFNIDDAGEAQFRLKNTGRGAQFVKYGERTCTTHFERDFTDRSAYDAFKAYTAQSITITASKGTNNSVSLLAPQTMKDTFEVNLSGQGDLVRAVVDMQNMLDVTATYTITVKTQELIS